MLLLWQPSTCCLLYPQPLHLSAGRCPYLKGSWKENPSIPQSLPTITFKANSPYSIFIGFIIISKLASKKALVCVFVLPMYLMNHERLVLLSESAKVDQSRLALQLPKHGDDLLLDGRTDGWIFFQISINAIYPSF